MARERNCSGRDLRTPYPRVRSFAYSIRITCLSILTFVANQRCYRYLRPSPRPPLQAVVVPPGPSRFYPLRYVLTSSSSSGSTLMFIVALTEHDRDHPQQATNALRGVQHLDPTRSGFLKAGMRTASQRQIVMRGMMGSMGRRTAWSME